MFFYSIYNKQLELFSFNKNKTASLSVNFKLSNCIADQRALKNVRNRLTRSMKADQKYQNKSELQDNFWRKVKTYNQSENSIPTSRYAFRLVGLPQGPIGKGDSADNTPELGI